jgi:NAD(P)-dependent dehydrogenase (short-subunit alcohol dehydrogenase family)
MSLKDQTVVILGGSSGIGLATAKGALVEGAKVIITGRSHDRLEQARLPTGDPIRYGCASSGRRLLRTARYEPPNKARGESQ